MPPTKPAAPAVLDTLEKVLASRTFARSERARKLLRYLVEQEQAGQAERLKGFTIAVDVFGRDADFDSSADAVVRVQAGRLRDLLAQYFATEGADAPIHIDIPRGSYVPIYEVVGETASSPSTAMEDVDSGETRQDGQPKPVEDTPAPASLLATEMRMMRHLQVSWAVMFVVVTMLVFVLLRIPPSGDGDPAPMADLSDTPTASIALQAEKMALPSVYVRTAVRRPEIERVVAILRIGISGFDTVDLIAHEPGPRGQAPAADPLQFVFDVGTGPTAGTVAIKLLNSSTGKVLVSRVLKGDELNGDILEDRIADLLSATVPATGAIYGYIELNQLGTGLVECLTLNNHYYLDPTPQSHEIAYRCFTDLANEGGKSPLIYSELAALLLKALTDGLPYPPEASLEQATTMAYRAVLAGPTSPYAHRAYGFLNSRAGDATEAIRFMRKAYELNTYDLSMAAAYGYALVFAGNYAAGAPIVERAVEASSSHPSWWDYGLFLAEFMLGDHARAARASEALASTKKSHYLAARLIAADRAGNRELTESLIGEIVEEFPAFAANPRVAFTRAKYPPDLIEKLVQALHEAGLFQPT